MCEQCRDLKQKSPFDLLAEGLLEETSRGDKMPLELFLAGVQALDTAMRARLGQKDTSRHGIDGGGVAPIGIWVSNTGDSSRISAALGRIQSAERAVPTH